MSRKPKVRTVHPLAVAASLEAQNNAVAKLVLAVDTLLRVAGEALPAEVHATLRIASDECRAAMWPDGEDA